MNKTITVIDDHFHQFGISKLLTTFAEVLPLLPGHTMAMRGPVYLISLNYFRGVAQLASALAWGARGRLFESDHPDSRKEEAFRLTESLL